MITGGKVERSLDRKIRVLRGILEEHTHEREDGEKKSHPCRFISTDILKIPRKQITIILDQLKLDVAGDWNIPLYGDEGEIICETDDYLFEVVVEKEDCERLLNILKEYEKQLPKRKKPRIREKTLELVAQKIGDLDSGNNLVRFLKNCGVDEELIVYPNTKWRMVFDVLVYLSSSDRKEDQEALSKIIGEATHPLMHKGNEGSALVLRKQFDEYLKYDNMGIAYGRDDGTYSALQNMDEEEADQLIAQHEQDTIDWFEKKSNQQLKFLCQPENKEKISILRKSYQLLENAVCFFCEDQSHPATELNSHFRFLYQLINKTIGELDLSNVERIPFSHNEHFFDLPFQNLFVAEKYYQEKGERLSWQKIRPEMQAMYGDIEDLYLEVGGSDALIDKDIQKRLNDIQLYLSTLRQKREIAKSKVRHQVWARVDTQSIPTTKIEITSLPELRIKKGDDEAVAPENTEIKTFPCEVPRGTKWQHFTINFLDKEKVLITVKGKEHKANFVEMGFDDKRNGTPNQQWDLLLILARLGGELTWKDSEAKKKYKKTVQLLADGLSAYFTQIDFDPFYPYDDIDPLEKPHKSYKIKMKLTPPQDTENAPDLEVKDDLGIQEELDKFNS